MGLVDGSATRFLIKDSGGTERDISQYVVDVVGIPGDRSLSDVTVLGDDGHRYLPANDTIESEVRGIFDDTLVSGPDVVLGALRTNSGFVEFRLIVTNPITSVETQYKGDAWLNTYEIGSRIGNLVTWKMQLMLEGGQIDFGGGGSAPIPSALQPHQIIVTILGEPEHFKEFIAFIQTTVGLANIDHTKELTHEITSNVFPILEFEHEIITTAFKVALTKVIVRDIDTDVLEVAP